MSDDDIADELLLRDTYEVTLTVDVNTARTLSQDTLARVLGKAAAKSIIEFLEEDEEG